MEHCLRYWVTKNIYNKYVMYWTNLCAKMTTFIDILRIMCFYIFVTNFHSIIKILHTKYVLNMHDIGQKSNIWISFAKEKIRQTIKT